MDTMLTFFLFIAFLFLLKSIRSKNRLYFFLTGFFWGLAILTKGQPAVIKLIDTVDLEGGPGTSFCSL
jgi:hypothetical protein